MFLPFESFMFSNNLNINRPLNDLCSGNREELTEISAKNLTKSKK